MHGHDETGLYYLHADRLGSTMATTNESGDTVDDHGYYAYGRNRRGSELRTDHRFTGQNRGWAGKRGLLSALRRSAFSCPSAVLSSVPPAG